MVFGLVVLREGVHANAVATIAMTAYGAVALLGVAALARHHPEARRGRRLRASRICTHESLAPRQDRGVCDVR
ncbi:hypothetical protein [Lawsonella clevelandensis]|uniref:hypothetical protein n=1 Tax=Lawsonella clevelandensis TaxID=1528099 RepID=UPI00130DABC4|nr:hypothetical protein [Lawsonella clevelandensis]